MMKKNLLATLIGLLLVTSVILVGCGPKVTAVPTKAPTSVPTLVPTTTTAPVKMTDGIYEQRFTPPGYSEYVAYFHFYPNGIFYLSLYNGGQYMAGYYEVIDTPVEWFPNIQDAVPTAVAGAATPTPVTAMTDKKIILTKLDGSEYGVVGYDSTLDEVVNLTTYYNFNFTHVLDSGHTDADETGVNVLEYYLNGDQYSLLALKHNGTFQDSINEIIEGTWAKDGNVYTLTDSSNSKTYTVTVNDDGTATYVAEDGTTTYTLEPPKTAEVQLTFAGTLPAAYGDMVGTTYLYKDNTARLDIAYANTTKSIDGTWSLGADYSITLILGDKTYTLPVDGATHLFGDISYVANDGTTEVTLVMKEVVAEKTLKFTWVGTTNPAVVLEMYSDGTCLLNYTGMGTVTQGTWTVDTSGQLPAWTITLEKTFDNAPIEVTSDYTTGFFFDFKNDSGQLADKLFLSFADYQAGAK
jgi:hypothetical protein